MEHVNSTEHVNCPDTGRNSPRKAVKKLFLTLNNRYCSPKLDSKCLSLLKFETWWLRPLSHNGRLTSRAICTPLQKCYFDSRLFGAIPAGVSARSVTWPSTSQRIRPSPPHPTPSRLSSGNWSTSTTGLPKAFQPPSPWQVRKYHHII